MICSSDFNEEYGFYVSLLTSETAEFNNKIITFAYSSKNLQCLYKHFILPNPFSNGEMQLYRDYVTC